MFTPRPHNPVLAALLTLLAAALLAGTTLLAKALGTGALGQPMHPLQISHGRFLFALMAIGLVSVIVRPRWTRPDLATHVGRSCLGWGGVTLMFAAAAFIPLSDATAISFLNPVFGMILAVPLLGERVGPVRWGAAGIALVGAAILTRPGGGVVEAGALLALGAAVCLGAELIFIKRLSGREGPWQILLINNAVGLVIASLAAVWVWIAPSAAQWAALLGIGLLMALAQTCFVNAMARGDASFVAPFFYTALVFAALYDGLVFGVRPDAVSVIGAAVILCGAGLLAWREGRRRQTPAPVPPA
ncbi:EamA-like transporter family protein [Roseovarius azorensis]|uniref:EamA-like transporter family protein n=1 Tax=Roseovarius azorensis TaxID=1287727 RepID=A0A1H7LKE1_9RHOB|nr:DMT family transporter [Roseovarius azorensis]SEK98935.1 EamA-like transporter family protein [Roseovarius azorensis]